MPYRNKRNPKKNRLSTALLAALLLPASGLAFAQDADESKEGDDAKTLEKVIVTGSLIPQTQIETATPVMVITAEDIAARGFTGVADALQKSTFATGSV